VNTQSLDEIERRLKAATPGPWEAEKREPFLYGQGFPIRGSQGPISVCPAVAHGLNDAEFIAHAPTDIATLLSAFRERDAEIARLTARVADLEHELGINAEHNAAIKRIAGEPAGLKELMNAEPPRSARYHQRKCNDG
jgi:hypothetical protein